MTTLFVAPLQSELDFFTQALGARGYSSTARQIGRLAAQHFPALDLLVARGGHGKTQFGVQTQHLLDNTSALEAVVCIGAAGALAADLSVGDLVCATETVEHDYTERFSSHPLPRFAGDAGLLGALRQLPLRSLPFGVHFGIIASGDEDVIELERAAALRQATEACAVAWEGAGGARACAFSGVPFVELRGITDTADHNAAADFRTNLRIAMASAAALVALWRSAH
jgi:adenosylhomocysteine nucleosidase